MSLQINLSNLATRIATECKAIRALVLGVGGSLSNLTTTAKGNLVVAVNELHTTINALISDSSGATVVDKTWSADKITTAIAAAKSELLNGAGSALDTLNELATALGNDANFATTMTTALGKRVRFDAAQTLTTPEKAQACANIGVGDPETNFVTVFDAGLV